MRKLLVMSAGIGLVGYLAYRFLDVNPLWYTRWRDTPDSVPESFVQDARARGWL